MIATYTNFVLLDFRVRRRKMVSKEDELQKKREEAERKARRGEIDPTHEFTFQANQMVFSNMYCAKMNNIPSRCRLWPNSADSYDMRLWTLCFQIQPCWTIWTFCTKTTQLANLSSTTRYVWRRFFIWHPRPDIFFVQDEIIKPDEEETKKTTKTTKGKNQKRVRVRELICRVQAATLATQATKP